MKKLQFLFAIAGLIGLSACHIGGKRHVIIAEDSNGAKLKIEYLGQAYFTADKTAIKSISPNGYVKYTRGDKELVAESDYTGKITYEVNDGGKQTMLNDNDKEFLAEAVRDMISHGHYADRR
ncbi:MAG: hypothetical protein JWQ66_3352 [Mucilaginibacter sp.]|nr:hypothetical protein [Mucilaginibacter sp.]